MEYSKNELLTLASEMYHTIRESELETLLKQAADHDCLNEFVISLKMMRQDLVEDIDEIIEVFDFAI